MPFTTNIDELLASYIYTLRDSADLSTLLLGEWDSVPDVLNPSFEFTGNLVSIDGASPISFSIQDNRLTFVDFDLDVLVWENDLVELVGTQGGNPFHAFYVKDLD